MLLMIYLLIVIVDLSSVIHPFKQFSQQFILIIRLFVIYIFLFFLFLFLFLFFLFLFFFQFNLKLILFTPRSFKPVSAVIPLT